ncbi:MAG TPA: glutathione S-transferase family protein [Leptolyngbyaceae cyanobacterium]
MASMAEIEIYSAAVCPFAQRSRLVLLEKGIDFEVIEIDLQNKPANFLEISPYGKVPVIRHGDNRVWESAIVNEYLEEVFPKPALLPKNPAQRALARIWIDFANTKLIPAFYKLLLSQEPEKQQEWAEELTKHLYFIEHEGLRKLSDGPYWLGNEVGLIDISYYPWFERWSALEHYRGVTVPEDCTRLLTWWQAMKNLPSVQVTASPGEYHIEQYARYASNTASGTTAQELKRY